MPVITARLSVRLSTLTSRCSKRSPVLTKTWVLPFFSSTACRGTCSASGISLPWMMTRTEAPAFKRGSGLSNWNVTSKSRVTVALSNHCARLARPERAPTVTPKLSPGNESTSTTAFWPAVRLARSLSAILARTSILPDSMTSATGRPGHTGIAFAILRYDHAGPEEVDAVAVLLDRDRAVERCLQHQAVDQLLCALHPEHRLVAFFLHDGERRLIGGSPRLHVFFKLRETPLGFFERQDVLLCFHRGNQLVAARIELAAPDIELSPSRAPHRPGPSARRRRLSS